jgi:hypothetical protein
MTQFFVHKILLVGKILSRHTKVFYLSLHNAFLKYNFNK